MTDCKTRIVAHAIGLAEEGGFEGVRLRDVAARAGVALGTVYSRFKSKEDILIAALEEEIERFQGLMERHPAEGETGGDRVSFFFTAASRALFMRPAFARAVLRAVAVGEPDLAVRVEAFHGVVTRMVIASYRGEVADFEPTERERELGFLLQQLWFASLVGWMGELHDEQTVIRQMRGAVELVLRGYEAAIG